MKWWNEIKPGSSRHGWNIEYEPPSAQLLSIAPDAASVLAVYGWQRQWLYDDDNAFYMNCLESIDATADKRLQPK